MTKLGAVGLLVEIVGLLIVVGGAVGYRERVLKAGVVTMIGGFAIYVMAFAIWFGWG